MIESKNRALHDVRACGVLRHPDTYNWLIARGYAPGGMWHLPGGGPEDGEPPSETVVRELGEEFGVTVDVEPELAAVSWTAPSCPSARAKVTFVFDLGIMQPGTVITPLKAEIAEYAWRHPRELDSRLHPFDAERTTSILTGSARSAIAYLEQLRKNSAATRGRRSTHGAQTR